jgi:hypothetical protein
LHHSGCPRDDIGLNPACAKILAYGHYPLNLGWTERVAIMVIDGGLPHEEAERLAWAGLQTPGAAL